MEYKIQVGRDWRVIQTDDNGQIGYIDGSCVSDIDLDDISTCAIALARHQLDEGYKNSQDLSKIDDVEALRVDRYIDERRGK